MSTPLSDISGIIQGIIKLISGNPENQAFRLTKRQKRYEKRQLKYAEKELKSLEKDLSKDADGFTREDKQLIDELKQAVLKRRTELIKM